MLKRMFEMQRSLNVTIGRDTVGALQSLKDEWLHQYIFALEDEVYEFSISEDKDNVKIELIDMILFAISICQILDVTSEEIEKDVLFTIGTFRELYHSLHSDSWDIDQLHISIGSLKHQIEFKWWSKLIKENPDKQFKIIKDREIAKQCSINILIDIFKLAFVYGMAPHQIFSIYQKKHQVNLDRQKNGYDDRNKTEADNQKIISEISGIGLDKDLSIIDDMDDHSLESMIPQFDNEFLEINPIKGVSDIFKNDESYAWSWHCNIAMPIHDEGVDIEVANNAAARIMKCIFDYDSTPLIHKYRKSINLKKIRNDVMSNESKLITLLANNTDDKDKIMRSISAIEVGGGVLIIITTKQLDPVSNTYKVITESSTFIPESYISESDSGYEIKKK